MACDGMGGMGRDGVGGKAEGKGGMRRSGMGCGDVGWGRL